MRRVPRRDLLILAALVCLVAAFYVHFALRVGNFQDDEDEYVSVARYVASHFPHALTEGSLFPRGTQRLDQLILAIPFAIARGPLAYQIGHVILCLLYASAAIPVFLLTRRAGLRYAACMLAAALTILVPWCVTTTSFLSEPVAYPAFAWVIYATWMDLRSPSLVRDFLALLALLIGVLARTAFIALVPLLPLAVVWHELGFTLASKPWRARLRALPGSLWRGHRLLTALTLLALLAVLADRTGLLAGRGLASLAGDYGLPHIGPLGALLARYRDYLARIAVGTGLMALVLALPWCVLALVRPRTGERQATAVVCALGLAAVMLSLLAAPADERYVMYAAVPIAIATAAALSELSTARPPMRLALGGVAVGLLAVLYLIASTTWSEPVTSYEFFTYPADVFYERVFIARLHKLNVPLLHPSPATLLYILLALAAAVWLMLIARSRRATTPAAVMGVGLLALCITQVVFTMHKYTYTAGEGDGASAAQRSWVDEYVPSGRSVGALALSLGQTGDYYAIWRATEFWNTSVNYDVFIGTPGMLPFPLGSTAMRLEINPHTGLITGFDGPTMSTPAPLPPYLLIPQQGTNEYGLAGQIVATSTYLPLQLLRVSLPARIEWAVTGDSSEGFMTSGAPATATVYDAAPVDGRPRCASFSLVAPPEYEGRWPYLVTSGGRTAARGSIAELQTASVTVPLHPAHSATATTAGTATVQATVTGQTTLAGMKVSAKFAFFKVEDCPAGTGG